MLLGEGERDSMVCMRHTDAVLCAYIATTEAVVMAETVYSVGGVEPWPWQQWCCVSVYQWDHVGCVP